MYRTLLKASRLYSVLWYSTSAVGQNYLFRRNLPEEGPFHHQTTSHPLIIFRLIHGLPYSLTIHQFNGVINRQDMKLFNSAYNKNSYCQSLQGVSSTNTNTRCTDVQYVLFSLLTRGPKRGPSPVPGSLRPRP